MKKNELYTYNIDEKNVFYFAFRLVERSIEKGKKVFLVFDNEEKLNVFDRFLWTHKEDSFFPHERVADFFEYFYKDEEIELMTEIDKISADVVRRLHYCSIFLCDCYHYDRASAILRRVFSQTLEDGSWNVFLFFVGSAFFPLSPKVVDMVERISFVGPNASEDLIKKMCPFVNEAHWTCCHWSSKA